MLTVIRGENSFYGMMHDYEFIFLLCLFSSGMNDDKL